jgi:hypothetical protein
MTSPRPHRYRSFQKKFDDAPVPSSGDARLKAALARRCKRSDARAEDPRPYDEAWGWWIEDRIAIGALAAEIVRIFMVTTGLGS